MPSQSPLPTLSALERQRLLTGLLREVSRSFYLTLRVLPASVREPISVAYLLARAADTLADTRALPPARRLEYLLLVRDQLHAKTPSPALAALAADLADQHGEPGERRLLQSIRSLYALLQALPEADRARVIAVVTTLTQGMELDLATFPNETSGEVSALPDAAALDQYIYLVAGCVGEFWTEMLCAHEPALSHWDAQQAAALGVRFGKALQLTNVLRDVARDVRHGRCYLPQQELRTLDLMPTELLRVEAGPTVRPILVHWTRIALDHYAAAIDYTLTIPRRCWRLRLAALWPVLIGLKTLARLANHANWLDSAQPIKVPRSEVYRLIGLSLPVALSNALLRRWLHELRARVAASL